MSLAHSPRPKVGLFFAARRPRIPARPHRPSHCGRHVRAARQLRKGRGLTRPRERVVATSDEEAGISNAGEPSSATETHKGVEATAAEGDTVASEKRLLRNENGELEKDFPN